MKRRSSPPLPPVLLDEHAIGPGIAPDRVRELRRIIARRYGVELTYEQAAERGAKLVALYRMILGPIPESSDGS